VVALELGAALDDGAALLDEDDWLLMSLLPVAPAAPAIPLLLADELGLAAGGALVGDDWVWSEDGGTLELVPGAPAAVLPDGFADSPALVPLACPEVVAWFWLMPLEVPAEDWSVEALDGLLAAELACCVVSVVAAPAVPAAPAAPEGMAEVVWLHLSEMCWMLVTVKLLAFWSLAVELPLGALEAAPELPAGPLLPVLELLLALDSVPVTATVWPTWSFS
jgi:hypothetical protein